MELKHAAHIWIGAYLRQWLPLLMRVGNRPVKRAYLAIADHFEPYWGHNVDEKMADSRLAAWEKGWPQVCADLHDGAGKSPQHTFFYPLENYRASDLDRLANLCAKGWGDVEVHLHHDGESSRQLEEMLFAYAETLYQKHGLLRLDPVTGRPTYGFIHGNWALDNSRPDGRWCGVNDELLVLKKTGCYADFTLPAAPDASQTKTINTIYYATDDPDRPKSHDKGTPAQVGREPTGDLLIVQGVLALNWHNRKHGVYPRLEYSGLSYYQPLGLERVPIWLDFAPVVKGAEDICFIKLHCHGALETEHNTLLGKPMRNLLEYLINKCPKELGCEVRFVTCWEMVQMIHALERGEELL